MPKHIVYCPCLQQIKKFRANNGINLFHDNVCKFKPGTAHGLMDHLRSCSKGYSISAMNHFGILQFLELYYCKETGNWNGKRHGYEAMYPGDVSTEFKIISYSCKIQRSQTQWNTTQR